MADRKCILRISVSAAALVALLIGAALVVPVVLERHRSRAVAENEAAAIGAMRAYLGAQGTFQRVDRYKKGTLVYANTRDGSGFPDLFEICGPGSGGEVLGLVQEGFARARLGAPGAEPYKGYFFTDLVYDDPTTCCGLCAVPAEYRKTGTHTFMVDLCGTVYKRDLRGKAPPTWDGSVVAGVPRDEREPVEPPVEAIKILEEDAKALVRGNTAFALDLYAKTREKGTDNFVLSPFSVSVAMAALHAGARGKTRDEIVAGLRFALAPDNLHPAFQAAIRRSFEAAGKNELRVANAFWVQRGCSVRAEYAVLLRSRYAAEVREADFKNAPDRACADVNDWVAEVTRGRISQALAPQAVRPAAHGLFVNAIYFDGAWASPFARTDTKDRPFALEDGDEIEAPTMYMREELSHAENDLLSMVALPYSEAELEMVVLLPRGPGGLTEVEAELTPENLTRWLDSLGHAKVDLFLPRFSFASGIDLKAVLKRMGVRAAFEEAANLSGMSDERPLWIDSVFHRALIEVDEEGTVAAGMAGWLPYSNGVPIREFRADHPFIFIIMDSRTRAILFIGRVMDPRT